MNKSVSDARSELVAVRSFLKLVFRTEGYRFQIYNFIGRKFLRL